jgi:2-keto-4-pentenoate hydratase/2-oxohepta-3-ene-1,7-dioic acid hydratase in catechol pathway
MRFLTFVQDDALKLGAVTDAGVVDVAAAGAALRVDVPATPEAFFQAGLNGVAQVRALLDQQIDAAHIHDEASLTLGPAVVNPGKILCVGMNYARHARETGAEPPNVPVLFSKFSNTIAAPGEPVPMAADWQAVDYEAELVAVIGRRAKNVSEADALDYVLGYANANDISERDLQLGQPGRQWLLGKTPDKFLPIGPYLVTADVIPDPQDLPIKGWFNGELRQDSNTSDMIFSVAQVIAYATQYMTLEPGDVISTGTPEGVILGMDPKVYMQPGDEYTVEIGDLGRLTNKMTEA